MKTVRTLLGSVVFVGLAVAVVCPAEAGSIAIDTVTLKVNGNAEDIGKIDANLNGNAMDAEFTLDKAWVDLCNWTEFHWLQVVTSLVADSGNPQYDGAALKIPIIDTPNGGYDGQVGEDDQPWYLTAADIANHNLNGTNADGSKFFKTLDTPSVAGATFDTWLVAKTGDKEFCLISGFEWGSGTLGGMATLQKKNGTGVPAAGDVATVTTALANGAFAGWTATKDCDIICIPEPATLQLSLALLVGLTAALRRKRRWHSTR